MDRLLNSRCRPSSQDTAGQERFRTLTSSYYRGAQGVILGTPCPSAQLRPPCPLTPPGLCAAVYDITSRDTFDALPSWIAELDTFAGSGPSAPSVVRMIVGNKVDKEYSRAVSRQEGEQFAQRQSPPWLFMETSAKKGGEEVSGDEGLFGAVVDRIIERPELYTKQPAGRVGGPPGGFPRAGQTVALDEGAEADAGWCAC